MPIYYEKKVNVYKSISINCVMSTQDFMIHFKKELNFLGKFKFYEYSCGRAHLSVKS